MVIVNFGRAIPKCILVRTLLGSFLRFGLGCIFGRCRVCVRGAISPPPRRVCIIVIIVVFVVIILLVVLVIGVRGVHGLACRVTRRRGVFFTGVSVVVASRT